MIPSKPEDIEKLKKLAKRNIANGDWGDETTTLGLPGETVVPITPEEREAKQTVRNLLAKKGRRRVPKRR